MGAHRCGVVALALIAISCHGHGRSQLADPTFGLCTAATGATPSERVESAREQLRRGCYRDAFLAAVELRADPDEVVALGASLLALQARQAATAGGYDRREPADIEGVEPPEWLTPAGLPTNLEIIQDLGAHRSGDLEQLALALIRTVTPESCNASTAGFKMGGSRDKQRDLFVQYVGPLVAPLPDEQKLRVAAFAEAALCEFDNAAQDARAAAAALAADPEAACAAELDAVELEHMGGIAAELPGIAVVPQKMHEIATRIARGDDRARAARTALTRACGGAPSGEQAPRALYLEAVIATFLEADPKSGMTRARDAQIQARAVGRLDLLDASRAVEALASFELGMTDDGARVARDALGSFERRGAVGASQRLARHLMSLATALVLGGDSNNGVGVAKFGASLAPDLPLRSQIEVRNRLGTILFGAGRLDDALVAYREALAGIDDAPATSSAMRAVAASARGALEGQVELIDELVNGSLGEAAPGGDTIEGDIYRKIQRGDEVGWRESLEAAAQTSDDQIMGAGLVAVASGYCELAPAVSQLAGPMIQEIGGFDTSALQALGDDGMAVMMQILAFIPQIEQIAGAISACGAATGDVALVDDAEAMLDVERSFIGEIEQRTLGMIQANRFEADGRYAEATRGYLATARALFESVQLDPANVVSLAQLSADLYERAVVSSLRGSGDATEAISILEETRARGLRAARAWSGGSVSNDRLAALTKAERALSELQARRRLLGAGSDKGDDLDRAITAASKTRDDAQAELQRTDPAAFRAAALAPTLTADQLQQRLRDDEVLVYYVISTDHSYALLVQPHDVQVVSLAEDQAATALISDTRALLVALDEHVGAGDARGVQKRRKSRTDEPSDLEFEGLLVAAHDWLIAPLEPYLAEDARLIIVPDQITTNLPWPALGGTDDPLITRHAVRMLPGAYLLPDHPSLEVRTADAVVLGGADFGGVDRPLEVAIESAAEVTWQALPGTVDEANAIAKLYGVTPLTGKSASETALTKRLAKADLVHVATHGFAFPTRPSKSALVLSLPQNKNEDGLLHAYEIERMHLDAELVVLSACETARGQTRGGEGTLSLERAFLVAGAGAVVSSQWLVDDDSTAALMKAFHGRIAKGDAADVALQKAMNQVRRKDRWSDPYFWAAFRVVGGGAR